MLKKLRLDKGIPLAFVAQKLNVDRNTLRRVELGKSYLRVEWLPILSFLYGISKEELTDIYLKERSDFDDKK